MNTINIPIQISDDQIDSWAVTAFEGGINYWCDELKVKNNDYKGCKYASEALSKGATIIIEGKEITKHDILKALSKLPTMEYNKVYNRLLNEGQYDACDADVLFQVALYDDVIYG